MRRIDHLQPMHDGRREDAKLQCDPNDSEVFPKNNPDAIHSSFLLPPTLFIPFSNPLCTSHTLRPSKREIYSPFLPPHPENMSPSEKWTPARKKRGQGTKKMLLAHLDTLSAPACPGTPSAPPPPRRGPQCRSRCVGKAQFVAEMLQLANIVHQTKASIFASKLDFDLI